MSLCLAVDREREGGGEKEKENMNNFCFEKSNIAEAGRPVWCSYLEVVQVVSCVQVDAFGFLIDGHDCQTDVQRSMELPSLNLQHHKDSLTSERSCYDCIGCGE